MAQTRLAAVPCALLLIFLAGGVRAEEPPSASVLIADMASAYHNRDFQGRFIYMRGAEVSTLALKHAVIDGKEYERLTHLGGNATEVIRVGEKAVCIHADNSVTLLPETSGKTPFDLPQKLKNEVPRQYDVLLDGPGRVAGRKTWRLRLAPLDEHRFGYRLWVDHDSRLLLKSEMVDQGAVPLERIEFITLELDPGLSAADFPMPVTGAGGKALPPARANPGVRVEAGWLPGGFSVAVRGDHRALDGRRTLTATTFTDGLATFTVFVERDAADISEGISRMGPTVALTRRLPGGDDRYLVTLVGEIPQHTAERIMASLNLEAHADD